MQKGEKVEREEAARRRVFFAVFGLSFFWQFFRFSNIGAIFGVLGVAPGSVELCFMGMMVCALLLGLGAVAVARGRTAATSPRSVAVCALLPAGLFAMYALLPLSAGLEPLGMALMGLVWGAALVTQLLFWTDWLTSQGWGSFLEFACCLAASFALGFFWSLLCVEVTASEFLLALAMSPLSGLLAVAARRLCAPGEAARAGIPDGFEHARSFAILLISTGLFFILALSVSGSINSAALNPSAGSSVAAKHLVTIFELVLFGALALLLANWRKLLYAGWLLFAVTFLLGLVLTGLSGFGLVSSGVSLVTASRGSFELLLFVGAVLSARRFGAFRSVVVVFLVPEVAASLISRGLLPMLYRELGWTFNDYIPLVSLVLSAILVVGVFALLAVELFARIDGEKAEGAENPGLGEDDMERVWDTLELSPAERRVARYLCRGYTSERVAEQEHLSVNTVRSHIKSIYRKAQVHTRQEFIELVESGCTAAARVG